MALPIDSGYLRNSTQKSQSWGWLVQIYLKPKKVFASMNESAKAAWVKPMLVLSVLAAILSLAGGPSRLLIAQQQINTMPQDFQYWTEEQQIQYIQGQQALQGDLFIYVFPLLKSLAELWLGWLALASILHLLMTIRGSRISHQSYLNLIAWAGMPFALRSIVQTLYILITHNTLQGLGLSGLVVIGEDKLHIFLSILLSMIDLYSLWFIFLLFLASPGISGLKPLKARFILVVSLLIFTILAALPNFLLSILGNIGKIQPFIMF